MPSSVVDEAVVSDELALPEVHLPFSPGRGDYGNDSPDRVVRQAIYTLEAARLIRKDRRLMAAVGAFLDDHTEGLRVLGEHLHGSRLDPLLERE